MIHIREILVPTDFSAHSKAAFHLAAALARDHHAKLLVLHVREAGVAPFTPFGTGPICQVPPLLKDEIRGFELEGDSIAVEYAVSGGAPAEEIVRMAAERRCDLIVLGTHGRTGVLRLLIGSVAEQVIRTAPCPVLTIRNLPASEAKATGADPALISMA